MQRICKQKNRKKNMIFSLDWLSQMVPEVVPFRLDGLVQEVA
jgi:hypothetical protein